MRLPTPCSRWALFLAAIALCLPGLFAGLGRADATNHMEVMSLQTSQETWLRRQDGEETAWLMPSWNGRPRLRKPPMSVWIHLVAWTGLTPTTASVADLVTRARLVAGCFMVATLAATFWIGCLLRDDRHAFVATVATGTMLLLLRQAKFASYDTHLLGWVTLAVACGLHAALRRETQPIGALFSGILCGVSGGFAVLTKGPLALALVFAPLVAMVVTFRRRLTDLLNLALPAVVAAAVAAPWYTYALTGFPEAGMTMATEYRAERDGFQPPWYYVGLVVLVLPWSLLLLEGLRRPFHPLDRNRDPARWLPWVWFITIFVLLSIPGAKQQRYVVPILPAAGLLVAEALQTGRQAAWVRQGHSRLLICASILIPPLVLLEPWAVSRGWLRDELFTATPRVLVVALGAMSVALALAVRRTLREGRGVPVALLTAAWMSLLHVSLYPSYAARDRARYPARAEAERMARSRDTPAIVYVDSGRGDWRDEPDQKFLLYARRVIPPVKLCDLDAFLAEPGPGIILSQDDAPMRAALARAGLTLDRTFHDGRAARAVWVH